MHPAVVSELLHHYYLLLFLLSSFFAVILSFGSWFHGSEIRVVFQELVSDSLKICLF